MFGRLAKQKHLAKKLVLPRKKRATTIPKFASSTPQSVAPQPTATEQQNSTASQKTSWINPLTAFMFGYAIAPSHATNNTNVMPLEQTKNNENSSNTTSAAQHDSVSMEKTTYEKAEDYLEANKEIEKEEETDLQKEEEEDHVAVNDDNDSWDDGDGGDSGGDSGGD